MRLLPGLGRKSILDVFRAEGIRLMAANVVLLGRKVTALQKSLSWITGATSMRGKEGKWKEGGRKAKKGTGENTPNRTPK